MTPRELRTKRKQWRKHSNEYYRRKKNTGNTVLPDTPTSSETSETPAIPIQRSSGRKRVRRDRTKMRRMNKKLISENEKQRRLKDKYKIRYYRLINQNKYNKKNKDLTPTAKLT